MDEERSVAALLELWQGVEPGAIVAQLDESWVQFPEMRTLPLVEAGDKWWREETQRAEERAWTGALRLRAAAAAAGAGGPSGSAGTAA